MTWIWLWKKTCPGICGLPAADDRLGERFRDVALCKLADAKRRIWGLRERCRLAKTLPNRPSITTAFGAGQNLASRRKSRSLNHLAELLWSEMHAGQRQRFRVMERG